jgi:hypothetical protein
LALVSTVAPPILVVFTTLDVLAAADPVDPPEEPELPLLPELPQAATARVATAKAVVAHHRLRIAYLHFAQNDVRPQSLVSPTTLCGVHT